MYIFPIKCSHWLKVNQNLTWKRVRGWPAAGMGCERRREQARGGSMISEGNDPTPSLPVFTICVALLDSPSRRSAGRSRKPGRAGHPPGRRLPGPGSSCPVAACRRPPKGGRGGDLAWRLRAKPGSRGACPIAAPLDVGAELRVQKRGLKRGAAAGGRGGGAGTPWPARSRASHSCRPRPGQKSTS